MRDIGCYPHVPTWASVALLEESLIHLYDANGDIWTTACGLNFYAPVLKHKRVGDDHAPTCLFCVAEA